MVFTITDAAASRILEIAKSDSTPPVLRVAVDGGGCSGFQYIFDAGATKSEDDVIFEHSGATVVIDSVSLDLLSGCSIDYVEDLGSASFVVINPKAKAKCGCGNSFSMDI
ncbi:iron-sulfur cluster assembly accessory protein [Candidatus Lariskella endosymbiont of Hedychridium roseum]|uniref:HesB/IscA family protein n=1 Tax=Candidatus Lariskella endosymbiont of Hedychridium roseum TaxID=3077949 RepID=UPI0030D440F5